MGIKNMLRNLSLLCAIIGIAVVGYAVVESINVSDTTQHFTLDKNHSETFTIEKEENFTLFLSELISGENTTYTCGQRIEATKKTTLFECESLYSSKVISFNLSLTSDVNEYYFSDMGNTTLTMNDNLAIGKVKLIPGTYTLSVTDVGSNDYVNVGMFQNSKIFANIFKIVFGSITVVGLFIAFIVLHISIKNTNKRNRYYDDAYYVENMNRRDKNKDLFNDDDPFAQQDQNYYNISQ